MKTLFLIRLWTLSQTGRQHLLSCIRVMLSAFILLCAAGCTNGALAGIKAATHAQFTFKPAAGSVVWWSADNTPQKRELTDSEAESGTVTLRIRKGSITPIMLYRKGLTEPDGCIWPVASSMDESGGFSARMLWRLFNETDSSAGEPEAVRAFLERFNWNRFCKEVSAIENPWNLDQQMILRSIADGTFTWKCLK